MRKLPLITSRSTVGIRGVYGQSVLELHEQIRRLLIQDTKDPAVANFFAEPQVNSLRGEISWFTDADGPITSFSALSVADQEALWQRLQTIRDRVKAVGEKYAARGGQTASARIDTFRSMLSVTNLEQSLFAVGGEPVICEWGCTPLGEGACPADLWTMGTFRAEAQTTGTTSAVSTAMSERLTADPKPEELRPEEPELPEPEVLLASNPEPLPKPEEPIAPAPPKREPVREKLVFALPPKPEPPREFVYAPPPRVYTTPPESRNWGGLWTLFKYLILFFLALLLLGALFRGCSASPAVVITGDRSSSEEAQLRSEISKLRQQVNVQSSKCAEQGFAPAPSSGATINQRVQREGRTLDGDLSIALKWNGSHDLDLYVREPSGQITGVGVPPQESSASGGQIDLDMNYAKNPASLSQEPVEVVKWKASPPVGEYEVRVRLFRAETDENQSSQEIPFYLVVKSRGQTLVDKTGAIPISADCKSVLEDCKFTAITSFELK